LADSAWISDKFDGERNDMGKYFGTDGFRGEANVILNADHAYRIGRFLGWYYGEQHRRVNGDRPRIVIGKDTRRSSYMFEYALVGGLTASGADAYLLHVTTTPSVAYLTRVDNFDCGIMISASHNPYTDNGIKLINRQGEKMDDATISEIEKYLDNPMELPFATDGNIGVTVDYVAGRNRYIGYLISLGLYSFRGIKVALDLANGASWNVAKAVFDALGAETHVINASPNGTNINLDAGSTHIEGLQRFVKQQGCDVGFAYDGDADRCLAVDENGNVVDGDRILYICGRYMKERGELLGDTVVATVASNIGLSKSLEKIGIHLAMTDVGDRNVYEYMMNHGCRIGGEQTGHVIFSKYESTGDGIVTSLKLMEVMCARHKKLGELSKDLEIYPQAQENVRLKSNDLKQTVLEDAGVLATEEKVRAEIGDSGRLLVRRSGTEPVIRIMAEAKAPELCERYVGMVSAAIRERGYTAD